MRIEKIYGKPTALFVEDAEDGGILVECHSCHEEYNIKDLGNCPHCGEELVYPEWASW